MTACFLMSGSHATSERPMTFTTNRTPIDFDDHAAIHVFSSSQKASSLVEVGILEREPKKERVRGRKSV